MRTIPASELIINPDGSIFHLHLRPEQIASTILLVGDPARARLIASHFDQITHRVEAREFVTITGVRKGKELSVISTGIGPDNMEIVVTELDALANIDFATRTPRPTPRSLTLIRLGTCGALQPDIEVGTLILSHISAGLDGLIPYYQDFESVCDKALLQAFTEQVVWPNRLPLPYFVHASERLIELFKGCTTPGITLAAHGFYAPQGRQLRLPLADPTLNTQLEAFASGDYRFTNFEMEGAVLAALAAMLGHEAITLCTAIAQRVALDVEPDYATFVDNMIVTCLEKLE